MLTIFLGLFLVSGVFAQTIEQNRCPSISSGKPLLNMQRYLGKWYEIERSGSSSDAFFKCQTVNYRHSISGSVKTEVSIVSEPDNKKKIFHGKTSPDRKACRQDIFGCAHLTTTIEGIDVNYTILGTDYTSYTVVFTCENFLLTHASIIAAYTRDPKPDQAVLDKISAVLKKYNLQNATLARVDQNCT